MSYIQQKLGDSPQHLLQEILLYNFIDCIENNIECSKIGHLTACTIGDRMKQDSSFSFSKQQFDYIVKTVKNIVIARQSNKYTRQEISDQYDDYVKAVYLEIDKALVS